MKRNFKQLSKDEIRNILGDLKAPAYATGQIIDWIYKKFSSSFDEMTNLSIQLRSQLKTIAGITQLTLLKRTVSLDGTQKFLFQLADNESVESVLIPNSTGTDRYTLCVSSQVGCALGCAFCVTGSLGFRRNLFAHEIVDQVISVNSIISSMDNGASRQDIKETSFLKGPTITNIVFMGMGEPLNNLNEVVIALRRFIEYMDVSKRKITVSTAGVVPQIAALAQKGPEVSLAISLNATTDETRSMIMPVNRKWPLNSLMQACRDFPLAPRRRITFEYVLLGGVNDSTDDAYRLVQLLKGIRSKINLIPYNSPTGSPPHSVPRFDAPDDDRVLAFQEILKKARMTAMIRKSMGADIAAACGQLKASYN